MHQASRPNLVQIWVNFGQKGPFKKSENVFFFDYRDYASSKKLKDTMCGAQKNQKTLHFGPKRQISDRFSQNGENDQKSSWKIFPDFLNPNFI